MVALGEESFPMTFLDAKLEYKPIILELVYNSINEFAHLLKSFIILFRNRSVIFVSVIFFLNLVKQFL